MPVGGLLELACAESCYLLEADCGYQVVPDWIQLYVPLPDPRLDILRS